MGLDMYLAKRGKDGRLDWESEFGYWRKANQIHKWFVDNVQDGEDECKSHDVSKDKVEELLSLCNQVLEDNYKAEELLPVQNGFFFGGTDYDEWYFSDIQQTKKILENVLENFDFENETLAYLSSW